MENHKLLALYSKANSKSNSLKEATVAGVPCSYTFKYLNYKENHIADNNKCLF